MQFRRKAKLLELKPKMQQGYRLARLLVIIQGILFEKQILPYVASANVQNVNLQKEPTSPQHNSPACKEPPRNYEIEACLKNNNLTYEDFMPSFVK